MSGVRSSRRGLQCISDGVSASDRIQLRVPAAGVVQPRGPSQRPEQLTYTPAMNSAMDMHTAIRAYTLMGGSLPLLMS
jgi:hypothetical protein